MTGFWFSLLQQAEASEGVSYRSKASADVTSGPDQVQISKPTGTVENDLMLVVIGIDAITETINSVPSDWTLVDGPQDSPTGDCRGWTYYKVAGASEPSDYTWGFDASTKGRGIILTYTDNDSNTATVINQNDSANNASGTSHPTPSITPTFDDCMIFGAAIIDKSSTQTPYWTPPSGWTERADEEGSGFVELGTAEFLQGSKALISGTFTSADSDQSAVFIIAIAPAGGAPEGGLGKYAGGLVAANRMNKLGFN